MNPEHLPNNSLSTGPGDIRSFHSRDRRVVVVCVYRFNGTHILHTRLTRNQVQQCNIYYYYYYYAVCTIVRSRSNTRLYGDNNITL